MMRSYTGPLLMLFLCTLGCDRSSSSPQNQGNAEPFVRNAEILISTGRLDEAEAMLKDALSKADSDGQEHIQAALNRLNERRKQLAAEQIDSHPNIRRAFAYLGMNHPAKAITELKAVENDPNDAVRARAVTLLKEIQAAGSLEGITAYLKALSDKQLAQLQSSDELPRKAIFSNDTMNDFLLVQLSKMESAHLARAVMGEQTRRKQLQEELARKEEERKREEQRQLAVLEEEKNQKQAAEEKARNTAAEDRKRAEEAQRAAQAIAQQEERARKEKALEQLRDSGYITDDELREAELNKPWTHKIDKYTAGALSRRVFRAIKSDISLDVPSDTWMEMEQYEITAETDTDIFMTVRIRFGRSNDNGGRRLVTKQDYKCIFEKRFDKWELITYGNVSPIQ